MNMNMNMNMNKINVMQYVLKYRTHEVEFLRNRYKWPK